ncbi:aminotransferase class I/II-fold pyridoxal phosphate-dependent enzyme [Nocardioides sp. AE5]|uniref:MalY/PatB family protein n=1 Tax=Nocardioides sp. AE5 TaxID=2962573 RepID=UPI002882848B|nr:aminotransferase class I/II-fold pyridoxal phosphate-dependent enzyme [Nocardioides sp. AE5]MDT0200430.1 aminotransferase class I/II-fold pyridoxal phosphate-dependent enzyme [Nocardioides sp. AE5]
MRILGESLARLRATRTSVKWRFFEPEVLPVWVAEMDARPCPEVVEVVTTALHTGDTGYAWAAPYAAAFAGFSRRRWGWAPDPATMMLLPDVMIGIEEILHVLPGDAVVVSPPCYDSFHGFVASVRKRAVLAPLGLDHRLDAEALERAFIEAGPGAAYLLCNPHNPTGTVNTPDELAMLAALADRHGIQVISDEIHAPLTAPGATFTPYLQVPGAERGIAVVSASKSWNLAGLKAALAVPGPEASVLDELHEVVTHGANHVAVLAQTAAYAHGDVWLDRVNAEIAENRALLVDLLVRELPQVAVAPAEATYLAWLDCRALGLPGVGRDDPAAHFLEHGRVALASGLRYDPVGGAGWARFNLGTSPEVITEAVRRMVTAVR